MPSSQCKTDLSSKPVCEAAGTPGFFFNEDNVWLPIWPDRYLKYLKPQASWKGRTYNLVSSCISPTCLYFLDKREPVGLSSSQWPIDGHQCIHGQRHELLKTQAFHNELPSLFPKTQSLHSLLLTLPFQYVLSQASPPFLPCCPTSHEACCFTTHHWLVWRRQVLNEIIYL